MIAAFQLGAVESPAGEWHTAMRAGVLQGKGSALRVAAEHKGRFEQHSFRKLVAPHAVAGQRTVPEAAQHQRIWDLGLGGFVEHGGQARVLQSPAIFGTTFLPAALYMDGTIGEHAVGAIPEVRGIV
jgi:hypothetical protein